jgi:hypothetical protein
VQSVSCVLRLLACAAGSICILLLGTSARKPKPRPQAPATEQAQPAAPKPPPVPPRIPLQRNLRFVVRPTLLGLVPPPDPLNFGEAFVRVLAADREHIWLRYQMKEQLQRDPASGEIYLLDSAPVAQRVELTTRIRRGDLQVQRQGPPGLLPPMLWPDGAWTSVAGLLWLDGATYSALADGGEPAWDIALPGDGVPLAGQLAPLLEQRRLAAGLAPDEPLTLRVLEARTTYRCLVNGAAVDLPALRCVDSMLLGEYWVLADAENPLLLKLSYLPLQEADPAATGWAAMFNAGGGCAITQIDF